MKEYIVVDLETVGTRENAPVLSASALYFDLSKFSPECDWAEYIKGANAFHMVLDKQKQSWAVDDPNTIKWWQDEFAKATDHNKAHLNTIFTGQSAPLDFTKAFSAWIGQVCADPRKIRIFERGPGFDTSKIERMYVETGMDTPYRWWNIRDVRSWIDAKGLQPPYVSYPNSTNWSQDFLAQMGLDQATKHHSLHDCAIDGFCLAALAKYL